MELANGLKIQGGPIKTTDPVITFVIPFSNPDTISLTFGQTNEASASVGRIAIRKKPTATGVALTAERRAISVYASWLAVGF